jgi:hypothetical protein
LGDGHLRLDAAVLRELAKRLQILETVILETVINETNRQLNAAQIAAFEDQESGEHLLDRALASLERLNEIAEAMMRCLDELLTAAKPEFSPRGWT